MSDEKHLRDLLSEVVPEAPPNPSRAAAARAYAAARRRRRIAIGATTAAVVTALVVPFALADRGGKQAESPTTGQEDPAWRWVSYRDVEVKAPAAWNFDYEALRPDCIDRRTPRHDPWAKDVPRAPYVMVGVPNRPVPLIGCLHDPAPGDPDPAFGDLPFTLWQPFVKLDEARPDLDYPDRNDGQWQYRDWRLTRATIDQVQITVLASPEDPSLGGSVLDSVRRVETTSLGCEPGSPVQAQRFAKPSGSPVPAADQVASVAVCEYSRRQGHAGLEGSRRISGEAARQLVEAINTAPSGGGPDDPGNCLHHRYGDSAIALRFFATSEKTDSPLAEAYVYYDRCFGNGIIDAHGKRHLTKANCAPLFAAPPISLWSGQRRIVAFCGPLGAR
jgi:hypothetical protein